MATSAGIVIHIHTETYDPAPNSNIFFQMELLDVGGGTPPKNGLFQLGMSDNFDKAYSLLLLAAANHIAVHVVTTEDGEYSYVRNLTIKPPSR